MNIVQYYCCCYLSFFSDFIANRQKSIHRFYLYSGFFAALFHLSQQQRIGQILKFERKNKRKIKCIVWQKELRTDSVQFSLAQAWIDNNDNNCNTPTINICFSSYKLLSRMLFNANVLYARTLFCILWLYVCFFFRLCTVFDVRPCYFFNSNECQMYKQKICFWW